MTENPTDGPIHGYFELSYATHLVKERTLLQSMPIHWQEQMVRLLNQFDAAFEHVAQPSGYQVTAGKWMQLDDMTDSELRTAGIEVSGEDPDDGPDEDTVYHRTSDGAELYGGNSAFLPRPNPIPHYRHAYIEPRLTD
ncbi:hypothetical protein ACWEG1_05830 [Streptomyces bauhiniae]